MHSTKIKILFLIQDLGNGGAERVLVNLANALDKSVFDITVITLFSGGVNEENLNRNIRLKSVFNLTFPGNTQLLKFFSPKKLHSWLIKESYDIEIAFLEGSSTRIISGCQNKQTCKIAWVHSSQFSMAGFSYCYRSADEALACYQRFDSVAFVSNDVRKAFLALCPSVNEPTVVYNTNDTRKIERLSRELVEPSLFQPDAVNLIGIGKVEPLKNFRKLVEVQAMLKRAGIRSHSYVVGEGSERESVINYAKELGVDDSFTMLGFQTNPYKYLAKADVFICTSLSEGFSTAATEALILGVPVVTTPVSGMEELLGERGNCGIITDGSSESIFEAVCRMASSREVLDKYKKCAQSRGVQFQTDVSVKGTERYFQHVRNVMRR